MAICKSCGKKYSKWITPVSAKGACADCFEPELSKQETADPPEDMSFVPIEPVTLGKSRREPIHLRSFLPRTRSKLVFVLVMACYCITVDSFLGAWARAAGLHRPSPPFYLRGNPFDVFSLLVAAPLIESLIMVVVLELVRWFRAPEIVQVLAAAAFISEAHAWPWWPRAFILFPSFCIYAGAYLYWRHSSRTDAFWVMASIHALNNAIPALYAFTAYTTRHV